jgi:hypothetical protein
LEKLGHKNALKKWKYGIPDFLTIQKVPPSKKICRKKQCPHPTPPPGASMTVPTPIDVDVAHNSDNTVQWKLEKKTVKWLLWIIIM